MEAKVKTGYRNWYNQTTQRLIFIKDGDIVELQDNPVEFFAGENHQYVKMDHFAAWIPTRFLENL